MEDIYKQMFGRNIGNVTEQEQEKLAKTTVAVAGAGGTGGAALFNLARMGIGHFKIADPESYAYTDLNRQQGSTFAAVGTLKVEAITQALKAINPSVQVTVYPEGLQEHNVENFLDEVSIVVDGLDFFCLAVRKKLFDAARTRGLYILSCPIFGFGTALAVFSPQGPSFDRVFGKVPEKIDAAYAINFGRTFFPVFPRYIDLGAYIEAMRKGRPIPSFATSCSLSGAVTASEALFILLNKRKPVCFPLIRHYDLFDAKIKITDSRKKKFNYFQKLIFKIIISGNKKLSGYKDFIDKL
ncbi:MAG: ThiF family adenylyltransferase [Candidatus Omnitrophota bacterium]